MSTSMVLSLCDSVVSFRFRSYRSYSSSCCSDSFHNNTFVVGFTPSTGRRRRRKRLSGSIPHAKKKRHWWQRFFFDDDGNWLGLKDEDMLEVEQEPGYSSRDDNMSEGEKFEAWRRRAEAIVELREAQENMRNEESRRWEDWLVGVNNSSSSSDSWDDGLEGTTRQHLQEDPVEMNPERGLVETVLNFVIGREDNELLYEDRVFQYASTNSAKFLAVLIIVPWALDFVTVPLAAKMLDVRKSQKLEMVEELKIEKARLRLEVQIGKAPPLSDKEVWSELRHKALELRDEWRLRNRSAFANIWSDMIFGISLFILLYFNQSKEKSSCIGPLPSSSTVNHKNMQTCYETLVALLKFTGYKIINKITDTGKAFLIILITDIFLGYHSESGWQTLLEVIVEHYGLEVDQSAITIFICLVPVIIDACVKLWVVTKFSGRLFSTNDQKDDLEN
ncbi:Chloroplast envelope membrane protein, CemA [Dillenia turbinata]|uniref:Chloroplast envelope membrane protein, CemA n=1 Tax=Dillenia turbinata TaxID=194707 RepID=A0AAN8W0Q4_9MAGN